MLDLVIYKINSKIIFKSYTLDLLDTLFSLVWGEPRIVPMAYYSKTSIVTCVNVPLDQCPMFHCPLQMLL